MTRTVRSESETLGQIEMLLADGEVAEAVRLVRLLRQQLREGYHRNPPLVVFGNPRGRRPPGHTRGFFGDEEEHLVGEVQAILYRHFDDDQFYCHGFGDADIDLKSIRDGVQIRGLKEETGVLAGFGRGDHDGHGRVLRVTLWRPDGRPIMEEHG